MKIERARWKRELRYSVPSSPLVGGMVDIINLTPPFLVWGGIINIIYISVLFIDIIDISIYIYPSPTHLTPLSFHWASVVLLGFIEI